MVRLKHCLFIFWNNIALNNYKDLGTARLSSSYFIMGRIDPEMLAVVICLSAFAAMEIGNGSTDSDETKEVVTPDNGETTDNASVSSDTASAEKIKKPEAEQRLRLKNKSCITNQNGIIITAKEYLTDSIWGDGIQLLTENDSDKSILLSCTAFIVNNYMITDLYASEIAAGKKANKVMHPSSSELQAAGIESVGQIEVYFHASNPDTYETIFEADYITIQTSEFANMDTTPADAGTELYTADGIKIVGKTVDENSFWGTAILLYCENKTGKNVGISAEQMSINGFMMNPLFSTTLYDGKMSIDDITIFSSDLEDNGIESIEEIELKFHIYDADSFHTITDSDAITFLAQ